MPDSKIKKSFLLFFLFLGILSIVTQVFFSRELLAITAGNEIIIGMIIFWWFLFVGLGSLIKVGIDCNQSLHYIITSYLALGCFLLLDFLVIKFIPSLLPFAGELIPVSWAMLLLPAILFPVCFLLGLEFRLGTQFFSLKFGQGTSGVTTNKAYLLESLGFVVGGLAFNFLFIFFLSIWLLHLLLVALILLNLSLYLVLIKNNGFKKTGAVVMLLFILILIITPKDALTNLNNKIQKWQYRNQRVVKSVNSRYGNIAVTKINEQYNFFTNGYFLGPTKNIKEIEETVLLPLLTQEQPADILIIGNGWNGLVQEMLKLVGAGTSQSLSKVENLSRTKTDVTIDSDEGAKNITYLEIDERFVKEIQNFLPEVKKTLNDPKVELVTQDAVTFLKANNNQYDIIIVSQPPPFSFLFNRFYTQEFFGLIENSLMSSGVFMFGLPGLAENISDENQEQFLGSIFQTLKKQFTFVQVLPGDKMYFLASQKEFGASDLVTQFTLLNLNPSFVSEKYIEYLFQDERTKTLNESLNRSAAPLNKDLQPYGFLAYTKFWSQLYSSKIAKMIDVAFNNRLIILSIISLAIILLLAFFSKKYRRNSYLFISIILASATLMVLELTIILLWQVLFGYIYSQIALILALVMAGLALGNFVIVKKEIYKVTLLKKLQKVYLLLILSFLALMFREQLFTPVVLGGYALAFGFITGTIFPLTNKLYLEKQKNPATETGKIYGAELVGSGILILLFNLFLIPMFGFGVGLVFLLGLNLILLVFR